VVSRFEHADSATITETKPAQRKNRNGREYTGLSVAGLGPNVQRGRA
jgi:hypothetical protein